MNNQPASGTSSSDINVWTWILLAVILLLSAIVAVGALGIVNANSQMQMPTGSQSVPSSH